MRISKALFTLALLTEAFGAAAETGADFPTCDYSIDSEVRIDANTGAIYTDRTDFLENDSVDVEFVNKNSFKYNYGFSTKGVSVDAGVIEGALGRFNFPTAVLNVSGDPAAEAAIDARKDAKTQEDSVTENLAIVSCPSVDEEPYNTISADWQELENALIGQAKNVQEATNMYDKTLGVVRSAEIGDVGECRALRSEGKKLKEVIVNLNRQWAGLKNTKRELEGVSKRFHTQFDKGGLEAIGDSCPAYHRALTTLNVAINSTLSNTKGMLSAFSDRSDSISASTKLATRVLLNPHAFNQTISLGPVREATDYTITITKASHDTPTKPVELTVDQTIRLGRPRYSYSVGLGVGFADLKTYGRVAGVNDLGETTSMVGQTESSDTQFGVVAQLNGRLFSVGGWDVGASIGAALTDGIDGTDFGPYIGLYTSPVNRLYLTAAYHLVENTRLSGGFSVGDVVPADLQGDVPTESEKTGAFLFTLTYSFDEL